LLSDLKGIFREEDADFISSAAIVASLLRREDRPWAEWKQGRPLSKISLARLLRPFGVKPSIRRSGGQTVRGYALADLLDSFDRYVPFDSKQSKQARDVDEIEPSSTRNGGPPVASGSDGEKGGETNQVSTVSTPEPGCPGPEGIDLQGPSLDAVVDSTDVRGLDDVGPVEPCRICGATRYWRSIHGPVVCGTCHPPASPDLVDRWLDGDDQAST
jgi:hypothetical protein